MWGRGYYRPQQQTTGLDALSQIVGAIAQRNQDKSNNAAMMQLLTPTTVNTSPTQNTVKFDPSVTSLDVLQQPQYTPQVGLLTPNPNTPQQGMQGVGFGADKINLFNGQQPTQQQGFQYQSIAEQPTPQQPSAPVIGTRQRTMKDIETDIRKAHVDKWKVASKQMDAGTLRQMLPQLQQQMQGEIATAKKEYMSNSLDEQFTKLSAMPNMDSKKMFMWATQMKNKGYDIDPAQAAKVFEAKKLESLNLGDRVEMIDPTQPGTYQMGINPQVISQQNFQAGENEKNRQVTREGNAIRASNNGASGGKYVDVPGLGSMTVNELLIRREAARPKKKVVEDAYGQKTTVDEGDPTSYAILDRVLQSAGSSGGGGGQPQGLPRVEATGDARIDGMAANMRARGATEQQINDMVWLEQNKPQPQPKQTYSGNEYLGL